MKFFFQQTGLEHPRHSNDAGCYTRVGIKIFEIAFDVLDPVASCALPFKSGIDEGVEIWIGHIFIRDAILV